MKCFWLLTLVILSIGCGSAATVSVEQNQAAPTPTVAPTVDELPETVESDIPKSAWKPIFFETISNVTNRVGIEALHKTSLQAEDIEIRIWYGFGKSRLEGFVLKRNRTQWNGSHIYFEYPDDWNAKTHDFAAVRYVNKPMPRSEPRSGWSTFWTQLRRRNILTLPNADSIDCRGDALDGFSYVVEIRKGENYRTYMYDNPEYARKDCKQAEDILVIGKMIREEFDLNTGTGTSGQ